MVRGEGRKSQKRGAFGTAHKLPSGRFRAMYFGPDGRRYKGDRTFLTEKDARGWLSLRQAEIIEKSWKPPGVRVAQASLTLETYADQWLPKRKVRGQLLKTRTREHYRKLLDKHILPTLGDRPIGSITRDDVEEWYDNQLDASTPTLRAHCYGLLSTIMRSAVAEGKATISPCVLRGAGSTRRVHKPKPATLGELEIITKAMPERFQAMILLAAWAALRFGEITQLRRSSITIVEPTDEEIRDAQARGLEEPVPYGIVHVEEGVVRTEGGFEEGTPKSEAGIRDVELPPHLLRAIKEHLENFTGPGDGALLFPAASGDKHLAAASLYRHYYRARAAANRKDLRFHDLRHSGAVLAAATGATLAELMARLGHSTPAAAMRYQHAAQGRDRQIAKLLSGLVENGDTRK
ncbi:tyrosine-type recombinase/integrase [Mycolicibacterium neoaurum]|uniref:tyrosine-type recombinase/integrase n=1 Tax=Mycolicibacterium neoaurum TaxID=1795 RepID=UPI001F4C5AA2|nr:site-specific integrase [Mycolicibacterium neoaurum]